MMIYLHRSFSISSKSFLDNLGAQQNAFAHQALHSSLLILPSLFVSILFSKDLIKPITPLKTLLWESETKYLHNLKIKDYNTNDESYIISKNK